MSGRDLIAIILVLGLGGVVIYLLLQGLLGMPIGLPPAWR